MSMEAAGHTPSNELLDQVMELYLLHKSDEPARKKAEAEAAKAEAEAAAAQAAAAPPAPAAAASAAAAPIGGREAALGFELAGVAPAANANPPPPPPGPPPLDMIAPCSGAAMSQPLPAMQHQPLVLAGGPPRPGGFVQNPGGVAGGSWDPGYSVPSMDGMGRAARWPVATAPEVGKDDLPVFSIPEEFSTIEEKATASKEAPGGGEAGEDGALAGHAGGTFNPDAAEFVPGGIGQARVVPAPEEALPIQGATRRDGFEANGYGGISASANLAMAMGRGADAAAYGFGGGGYDYGREGAAYGHAGSSLDMRMSAAEIGHNVWGGSFEASSEYGYAQNRGGPGADGYGNPFLSDQLQDGYGSDSQWDMLGQALWQFTMDRFRGQEGEQPLLAKDKILEPVLRTPFGLRSGSGLRAAPEAQEYDRYAPYGTIDMRELFLLIRDLGFDVSKSADEVKKFDRTEGNSDDKLDFHEFCSFVESYMQRDHVQSKYKPDEPEDPTGGPHAGRSEKRRLAYAAEDRK
ncbi:unnamed protein product [Prorocentrum cordatum]|nr:unnamed protein product [Polarella glacialis]